MHVETRLIVLHIDFQQGTHRCLLDGGSLPCLSVSDSHPIECCPSLLEEYLEIKADWVAFTLVDLNNYGNTLCIYYTCMIPSVVKSLKGDWIEIGGIEDGYIKKVVFEAGQKILAKL